MKLSTIFAKCSTVSPILQENKPKIKLTLKLR